MTIVITAFERSPDGGKGLARDTRVRWALEEVGQPYEVRLVSFRAMKEPAHLALHPFGQIPTYEEGDLALFESGSIVFHIADRYAGLLPADSAFRQEALVAMRRMLTASGRLSDEGARRLIEVEAIFAGPPAERQAPQAQVVDPAVKPHQPTMPEDTPSSRSGLAATGPSKKATATSKGDS